MYRFLVLLTACISLAALAEEKYSCLDSPEHRQFDFWSGSWQVSNEPGDKIYGHNTVAIEEDGCLLTESWQSASGGSGSSINYYNPGSGKWHQLWVDAGNSIIDIAGNLEDGNMVLTGSIYYLAAGREARFRGTWTPLPDGSVRQFFEEQDTEGVWKPWFDGYYRPVDGTKLP